MIPVKFQHKGDPVLWPDLEDKIKSNNFLYLREGNELSIGVLDAGMVSGRPSVSLRIDLPAGMTVVVETSAALFLGAARVVAAKYPKV